MQRLEDIKRALESDEKLAGIPIAHSEERDVADQVSRNLAQGLGLLVLISPDTMSNDSPDAPGPLFDRASVIIEVTENPILNRANSNLTGWQIAERIAFYLHMPNHGLTGGLETPVQAVMDLGLTCSSLSQTTRRNIVVNTVRFEGRYDIEMNQN